jgi:hypothetical protein
MVGTNVPLEHILGRESKEVVDALSFRVQKLRYVLLP